MCILQEWWEQLDSVSIFWLQVYRSGMYDFACSFPCAAS